jgi:UDP-3-O-[3-hydroxymyristoyl] glucosamine N-acyltransferase
MTFSAATIAQLAGGRVEGNAQAAVSGFGKIEEAQAGQLAFLANPKYEEYLYTTQASVVIVNESLELKQAVQATLIRVPDAYSAFAALLSQYEAMQRQMLSGREEPSFVHDTATMGNDVYIGAFAYIGKNVRIGNNVKIYPQVFIGDDVTIGDNTVLNPGVKVYHRCVLGKNVIVHAGTVIGSDGFGFAPQADGTFKKVPQMGNVVLEDDVEVGSNSTIDRATIGSTMVHAGAKIDNLVQIAHKRRNWQPYRDSGANRH